MPFQSLGSVGTRDRFKSLLLHAGDALGIAVQFPISQCQMAVDRTQVQLVELKDGVGQAFTVLPVAAKAGHPRINLELHGEAATAAAGEVLTKQRFAHAAQRRHQLPVQTSAQLFRLGEVAKHQHRQFQSRSAQFNAFLQGGDAEAAGSTANGGTGDGFSAMPITVSLDHRHECAVIGQQAFDGPCVGFHGRG